MANRFFRHPDLPFVECRCSTDSGRHYKLHLHRTFCVGAVERGAVTFRAGATRVELRPGSLALINPETLHACNPAGAGRRSYSMLFLDVAWCLQLQQSLWPVDGFIPANTVLLKDRSIYAQYVDTVQSLMGTGDLMDKEQRLAELIQNLFLRTCEPTAARRSAPSLRVQALKRELSANLDADLSLSQLAARLEANPYTLLRQFKAAAGITPHAYRLNCRIERAKQLLQRGMDLSHVALACGFFDQSHFHRYFKAMTTVTPKAYQRNVVQ